MTSNILDNMESPAMQTEARKRGWEIQHLTFSDYSVDAVQLRRWHAITSGRMECGDATNGEVIFEIKTLADAMNWEHLWMQCHKMCWTGLKCAVIVRDFIHSYHDIIKGAGKDEIFIAGNLHRFQAKCAKMGIPVFYTLDIVDTFNRMEYWFEHHAELPKQVNTFYLYKGDVDIMTDIKMVAVIPGIGAKRARDIVTFAGSAGKVGDDARAMELEDFQANYKAVAGWGPKTCKILWEAMQ